MRDYLDLTTELLLDTYLSIKYGTHTGGSVFVHYIVPILRKDGSKRTYGDLYTYFCDKDNFRFAIGYALEEESNEYWKAHMQYFYFDKNELPYLHSREIRHPLIFPKKR